jgi:hypothetical protein
MKAAQISAKKGCSFSRVMARTMKPTLMPSTANGHKESAAAKMGYELMRVNPLDLGCA